MQPLRSLALSAQVELAEVQAADLEQHLLQPIHLTTILGLQHHLHQPAVDGQPLPPTNLHFKQITNHHSSLVIENRLP
jgi:hypothetical protein